MVKYVFIFWLQSVRPMTDGGGGLISVRAEKRQFILSSLILFSAFNIMSDWFSCFFFNEGVRGFRC